MFQPTHQKICVECGTRIVGVIPDSKDGHPLCRDCSFRYEPQDKIPPPEIKKAKKVHVPLTPKRKFRKYLGVTALAISFVVLGANLPRLTSSLNAKRPARIGDARVDKVGDMCIMNLWRISKTLQDTSSPDTTLTCPASGLPYIVTKEGDDIVIECPSPKMHKVVGIRVSLKRPFPEVIQ